MARHTSQRGKRDGEEADLVSSGLLHELRQPLAAADAALKLVARQLGTAVTDLDGWRIASAQLARMSEMIATYRRLVTPGAVEAGPFAVATVVRAAVDGMRHRLDALGGRFVLAVDADVPPAFGVPQAVHHAVSNLLANALDAVEQAGGEGRILVRIARGAGGRAEVRVADEGTGIPPALRSRIFSTRFTTKLGRGEGLGLALSRRMMRAAGGEVRLAPEDDPARPLWAKTELVVELASGPGATAPRASDPRPPSRFRRVLGAVVILAGLAALLGASWSAFQGWVRAAAPPRPVAAVEAASPDRIVVGEVSGILQRLRDGAWQPVAPGAALQQDDSLRTGDAGRATILIGTRSQVTVSERTQLTVREITSAAKWLRLTRGRVSVDHQPDGARVLVVESERGDAVARAGAARFSVLATGTSLAVATDSGVVRLQGAGRSVEIAAGQQSVAAAGEPPSPAAPIPVALLIEIGRAATTAGGGCRIEGSAPAGAEVQVDGERVVQARGGTFSVDLPARRGPREALVAIRDASGRVLERRVPCAEPEPERVSDFAVRWGDP